MASKSKRAMALRPPKFSTRIVRRCRLCGRPRAVYRVRPTARTPSAPIAQAWSSHRAKGLSDRWKVQAPRVIATHSDV